MELSALSSIRKERLAYPFNKGGQGGTYFFFDLRRAAQVAFIRSEIARFCVGVNVRVFGASANRN